MLLEQIGVRFAVLGVDLDEAPLPNEGPEVYVRRVAADKARAGQGLLDPGRAAPVLAADTAVAVDRRILGKPRDREDAADMLRLLSGRTHRVLTAVAFAADRLEEALSISEVTFRRLAEAEIRAYWETGEPADKAGGYAIQGLGALFVTRLAGSCSGVMGLPLHETGRLLAGAGIRLLGPVEGP